MQAALILLFRWLAKYVMNYLTDFENWKTEEQYEDAMITKNYSYAFCNAYFPIIFVAFIANSVQPFGADVSCGNRCPDYLILLVGIIYLQNVIVRAVITMFFSGSAPQSADELVDDLDAIGMLGLRPRLVSSTRGPLPRVRSPPKVSIMHCASHSMYPDIIRRFQWRARPSKSTS